MARPAFGASQERVERAELTERAARLRRQWVAVALVLLALTGAGPATAHASVLPGGRMSLDNARCGLPDPLARWSLQAIAGSTDNGLLRHLSPWLAQHRCSGGGWLGWDAVGAPQSLVDALLVLPAPAGADPKVYARTGGAVWPVPGRDGAGSPGAIGPPVAHGGPQLKDQAVRVDGADTPRVPAVLRSPPADRHGQQARRAGWAVLALAGAALALLGCWRWHLTGRTGALLLTALGSLYALGAGVLAWLGLGVSPALAVGLATAALVWAGVSGALLWGIHAGLNGVGRQQGLAWWLGASGVLAVLLTWPNSTLLIAVVPVLMGVVGPLMVMVALAGLVFTRFRERAVSVNAVDQSGRLLFTALLVHGSAVWWLAAGWSGVSGLAKGVFVVAGLGVLLGSARLGADAPGWAAQAVPSPGPAPSSPQARRGRSQVPAVSVAALIAEQVRAMQSTLSEVRAVEAQSRHRLDELQTLFQSALHEMATPVAVMDTMLYSLNEAEGMDDFTKARLAKIATAAQQLQVLLGSCQAELGARDHGKRADWTAVCLLNLLEETAQAAATQSPAGHVLRVQDVGLPALFVCNRTVLRLVLHTLVSNAVKYSPPGSRVTLSGKSTPSGVLLEVLDNGPGVSAQDLARLFEPQFRGDNARGTRGTGMGLALGRHLMDMQGGKLTVSSRPGQGFHATVYLPSCAVLGAGAPAGSVQAA